MADEPDAIDPFGLPTTPHDQNPLFADPTPEELQALAEADAAAETETEETEGTEEAEAVAPAETQETPAAEEAAPAEPAETEEVAETETAETETVEELIFGKYKSLEEAGKGYDNLRDLQRRTAERARGFEQENSTVVAQARELETTLRQAVPYIKSLEDKVRMYEGGGEPAQPAPVTPEMVDIMVRQRTDQALAQEAQRRQQADDAAQRESALTTFNEKHPEIEVGDEVDNAMFEAYTTLEAAWEKANTSVNLSDPDTLEVLYEATKNPELVTVLSRNPQLIDDEQGMQLARFQAALLRGEIPITQETQKVPASKVGQRKLPVTERASTGGSAPAAAPLNEWQEAKRALAEDRKVSSGSPFFTESA